MTSATSTATGESGKGILRDFNAPPGRRPRRDACLTAAKHLPDRSRRVRLASASEVTLCGQRLRYLPQRLPLAVQLAHQRDDFRNLLSVCEAPTATATCRDLTLARGSQFGDQSPERDQNAPAARPHSRASSSRTQPSPPRAWPHSRAPR